ncbi:helix-turn-helix transcriptional regulator [Mycobacterium sp. HNNTM2301]|uniref:helix-turn-helix transcriptional regulator n=1 Tax=Mycobacterium hainanense TaxID=3289775 RepID=UPI0035A690A5
MTATDTADGDRFVSLRAAGERVGLSYWSIRGRVRDGLLPAYRTSPTSALRVKVSDVDALLTRVEPKDVAAADDEEPP